jgi:hypothetical protein
VAAGFAVLGGTRYCIGVRRPSCYELVQEILITEDDLVVPAEREARPVRGVKVSEGLADPIDRLITRGRFSGLPLLPSGRPRLPGSAF